MKFTGVALIMDGTPDSSGDIISPECVVTMSESCNVTMNFGDTVEDYLGEAKLFREQNEIKYEIELIPELITEQVAKILKPCVGGVIVERDGKILKNIHIRTIGLSNINADSRIKNLGET